MKKSFFVMVLVLVLVISVSSSVVSSQESFEIKSAEPSRCIRLAPEENCVNIDPISKTSISRRVPTCDYDLSSLFSKGDTLTVRTSDPSRLQGVHEIYEIETSNSNSIDPCPEIVLDLKPDNFDWPANKNNVGGIFRSPLVNTTNPSVDLDDRESGEFCKGQDYIINENITLKDGPTQKKFSCIANYSSDSRCYRGACQSCIDYDSSDGLSGNYTDKGITWNESYSFNPLEGKEDKCINSTHLSESYCNPNDPSDSFITTEKVNCKTEFNVPYSCKDGECYCNSILDYKKNSCTSDEVATLWDANCRVLDRKQVSCDYNNTGVVGDAIPFDSVKIDGEEFDNTTNYTDTGVRSVEIMDNGDIIRFDWHTEDQGDDPAELGDELNLEAIDFSSSRQGQKRGFIFVNNLSRSKTVVFDKFTGSNEVCVKDSEDVDSLNDFSNDCTGSDEVKLNCPGSSGDYNCEISQGGSHYKVWPLKHSGVVELTDSGINTNSICLRSDLNCNPSDWSNVTCNNGTKNRNCNIKQGVTCSGGVGNYETTTCSNDSDVNDGSGGLSGSGSGDVDATSDNLSNNTCTRNDWRCTSWGDCSDGTKKRVCSKKFDSSCSGGVNPETTSSEGCESGESDEVKETTQSSEGLPSWASASIIGGAALIVAIIVFFIVSKNKR